VSTKPSFKKVEKGAHTAPAGNPINHGNIEKFQPFVCNDLTPNMLTALCVKIYVELEK
jgi:hypothetical protein